MIIIYAFDQKPAGLDEGNEWVTFHNPSNESVDIGNWTFESTHGSTVVDWIPEGTTLYPRAYCIVKASKNRTPYIIVDPSDLLFPSVNVKLWVNQVTCPIINVLDYTYTPFYRWLDNSEEAIILKSQMTRNS